MNNGNGNGKSRTNGNGKKSGGLVTEPPLENLPTVDELLAPPNHQEHQTQQPETQSEQQSAEDLLRQAKQQTRTKAEEPKEPAPEPTPGVEQGGELVASASEQIGGAIAQAGQNLVDAQTHAHQQLIATGIDQARKDAEIITQAYQATLLHELSANTLINANSIREQLGLLRQHIDASNGTTVNSTLQNLGINIKPQGETANPLGEVVKNKQEVKGIQLFPKK